ncbi:MAG: ThuA domain-containing protein [Verrucomicrobiota bacterium]
MRLDLNLCATVLIAVLLGACLRAATGAEAPTAAQPVKQAQVLLVTGIDYPGHLWRQTAPALAGLLGADGRFKVQLTEEPGSLGKGPLDHYDAIILHFMNWETNSPGEAARSNLCRFVEGGKGLILLHFACGAWQDWPEFERLAGRVYDPKLRPHDPHGAFRVEIAAPGHPAAGGLKAFETTDELYTCLRGQTPIEVVATARSKVDQKDYPMAFVLKYGQGRVFHTVLGHDVRALTNSAVPQLLRNGCAWAAGRQ